MKYYQYQIDNSYIINNFQKGIKRIKKILNLIDNIEYIITQKNDIDVKDEICLSLNKYRDNLNGIIKGIKEKIDEININIKKCQEICNTLLIKAQEYGTQDKKIIAAPECEEHHHIYYTLNITQDGELQITKFHTIKAYKRVGMSISYKGEKFQDTDDLITYDDGQLISYLELSKAENADITKTVNLNNYDYENMPTITDIETFFDSLI